jgi:hypothetical protein
VKKADRKGGQAGVAATPACVLDWDSVRASPISPDLTRSLLQQAALPVAVEDDLILRTELGL